MDRVAVGGGAVVASGQVPRIDLGDMTDHSFFSVASIGFGVDGNRHNGRGVGETWISD